ncbi:nuclear transport factor 2 family protein [Segetibacter sp.]|jgi:ketosteroid isomerase-like protein|uniref:YybH family protein n=1 Tax=Segetibacter sp. TaxID=2231182 RepID=UPI00262C3880|nr:nuclear transport factor 2 family protein [Segetibacter sp.]MCW3079281.1 L-asparaginase [Segetibacter sp.]
MKTNKPTVVFKKIFYLLIIIVLPIVAQAQSADEQAIKQVLEKQLQGWNKGNMEEYMKGYWQSDSLLFIGKSGPKWGYETTLENYKKGYADTAAMGKLQFDLLQLQKLAVDYYYVTGKWALKRSIGDVQGYFTLLFKKIKNNWVIISDHSS